MSELLTTGMFCPNLDCPDRGACLEWRDNITKRGKTKNGYQRFLCGKQRKTFSQNKNSFAYYKKTQLEEILQTLTLIAKGAPLRGRIQGHKKETVQSWINKAYQHRKEMETLLKGNYGLKPKKLQHLWSHVKKQ